MQRLIRIDLRMPILLLKCPPAIQGTIQTSEKRKDFGAGNGQEIMREIEEEISRRTKALRN